MERDTGPNDVTRLLAELGGRGGELAAAQLFPLVFEELRALAASQLRRERAGHTLQPTALVNEAFLRLAQQHDAKPESRSHVLALAALAMRRVLVDHALRRQSEKRGGGRAAADLDAAALVAAPEALAAVDVLALDEALERLAALDARKAKVVELRWFAGLSVEEVAEAQVSLPDLINSSMPSCSTSV